ncbi:MAG: hypothetical protein LDL30_03690 [Desulfovibrio sp.]|nr:hypothetical protein [Desulfovibrio sp.]MCA1986873.1 hypothetical protein [Desulfovibrio sp.]
MSRAWIRAKKMEFARDLLRDFCLATRDFTEIFAVYEATGSIDYHALRQLTGSVMNKGILWRLKDTSHLLLRSSSSPQPQYAEDARLDSFLDWALGYLFHEVVKIREDAHQHENYVPWVQSLQEQTLTPLERTHVASMVDVLGQTRESLAREIARVRRIIAECIALFPHVLRKYRDSPLLARFLFSQEALVQEIFGDQREVLVEIMYEDEPQLLYLLAAQSLRQGGWWEPARQALARAQALRPDCPLVLKESSCMDRLCAKHPAARRGAIA